MRRGQLILAFLQCVVTLLMSVRGSNQSIAEVIEGRIVLPRGVSIPKDAYVTLFSPADGSRRRKVFPSEDGHFRFHGVPDGMHSLDIEAIPFMFPTIKIIKNGKEVKSTAADVHDAPVPYPLKVSPLQVLSYFEQRQKFDIMKWLKTPYGIMIAFGLFSVVLLPLLKVDPEEYKQMREHLKKNE